MYIRVNKNTFPVYKIEKIADLSIEFAAVVILIAILLPSKRSSATIQPARLRVLK